MDIITLIDSYVRGLLKAEEDFLGHLDTLPSPDFYTYIAQNPCKARK